MVAFGLLVELCLEWFEMECKQAVYGGVAMVISYGLKGNTESFVVDKNM